MNVGVLGWWRHDNQGDTKILDSITRALVPHHVVPIDLPFPLNEDSLQRLNLLDFLIVGGGGLFQRVPPPPFDTFDAWSRQLETPYGVVGVGVDQIPPQYRGLMSDLAEQARFFYVRDSVSQQLMGHPKVQVAPDLSFLYPLINRAAERNGPQNPPVCGVNLRQVPGLEIDRWVETLSGLPVRLRGIPLSTYDVWREAQILQRLDKACPTAFDPALYHGLEFVIGTAFHSIVFAIQAAIPVIAIDYAPKVGRLMTEIGLEDYLLKPGAWSRLPELVERVLAESDQLSDHLRETTTAMTESVRQAMAEVKELIGKAADRRAGVGPRVSIVVVGTSSDAANQSTLASCLLQTYEDVEVIFIGDDDLKSPSMERLAPELKVVVCDSAERMGERLNRALARATGEYLSWTVGGNVYARDAIACMANRLKRESAIDVVFTDYYAIHRPDLIADVYPVYAAHRLFRRDVVGPSFLCRRGLAEAVGPLRADTPLPTYDFWLRAHRIGSLHPMHAPLFYALEPNKVDDRHHAERRARRLWRSAEPRPVQLFWGVVDTDFCEVYVIRPAVASLRRIRSVLRRVNIRSLIKVSFSVLRTQLVRTDVTRWRNVARETSFWDGRNRLIAELIRENSTVLDLGSGTQALNKYLKSGCEYQPCDVVMRSADVMFCDFNRGVYPAVEKVFDYVVCSGVLEYVRKPGEFLATASSLGKEMLVSYAPSQNAQERLGRAAKGWVNHFTQGELESLLDTLGLCWSAAGRWHTQVIYRTWREHGDTASKEELSDED